MKLPVLIIGGGGHAKVVIEALRLRSARILGILDSEAGKLNADVFGVRVIGDDNALERFDASSVLLVNAIGSIHLPKQRKRLFEKFRNKGFRFATVLHPSAIVASDVVLGDGAQVMAGAVIQPGCKIGMNTIVNTRASVDHDCIIGDHVHLAPGVTLSGGVRIGDCVHVGTGATIIQEVTIGPDSVIGAGSVVLTDVSEKTQFVGAPARSTKLKI